MSNYERLPYGATKKMTKEERLEHKRMLNRRWRKDHPEWVKTSNDRWYMFYRRIKPYKCICKRCGREFDASRPYFVLCGNCPSEFQKKKWEIEERRAKRKKIAEQAVKMYLSGNYTQAEVAKHFGTYQRQISLWVNRAKKNIDLKK